MNKEKRLTILLLKEKLEKLSGKKVIFKEDNQISPGIHPASYWDDYENEGDYEGRGFDSNKFLENAETMIKGMNAREYPGGANILTPESLETIKREAINWITTKKLSVFPGNILAAMIFQLGNSEQV